MNKVVIWGHKLHSHTHSYIHYAFYKTFRYLNIETYWYDNDDSENIKNINFDNTLFITEGQVDEKIPINEKSYYVLHNVHGEKYNAIPQKNKMMFQVYTNSCLKYNLNMYPYRKNTYYDDNCLYTMWGTDLLPFEIKNNIDNIDVINNKARKISNVVAMIIPPWDLFEDWCKKNEIKYVTCGGFANNNVSAETNQDLIQQSVIAPALQSKWQIENDYIPCRIFKNISYGKYGITNSMAVNKLFDNNLIFNENVHDLCDMALSMTLNEKYIENLKIQMMDVYKNHTYLNILYAIFWYFKEIKKNDIYVNFENIIKSKYEI